MLKVLHLCRTPLADSPLRINSALNRTRSIQSTLLTESPYKDVREFGYDIKAWERDKEEIISLLEECDIIHFHNGVFPHSIFCGIELQYFTKGKSCLLQIHSSPNTIERHYGLRYKDLMELNVTIATLPQFHERYYPGAFLLPNFALTGPYKKNENSFNILFQPSNHQPRWLDRWETKCAPETIQLFDKLSKRYGFNFFSGPLVPPRLLQKLRLKCTAMIDDLVSGSFHITSLDTLAAGRASLCYIDKRQEETLLKFTGSPIMELPWVNIHLDNIKEQADKVFDESYLREQGLKGSQWIKKYWSEQFCVKHYTDLYFKIMNKPHFRLLKNKVNFYTDSITLNKIATKLTEDELQNKKVLFITNRLSADLMRFASKSRQTIIAYNGIVSEEEQLNYLPAVLTRMESDLLPWGNKVFDVSVCLDKSVELQELSRVSQIQISGIECLKKLSNLNSNTEFCERQFFKNTLLVRNTELVISRFIHKNRKEFSKYTSIVLYGAGKNTTFFIKELKHINVNVRAVIQDNGSSNFMNGIPVADASGYRTKKTECIVITPVYECYSMSLKAQKRGWENVLCVFAEYWQMDEPKSILSGSPSPLDHWGDKVNIDLTAANLEDLAIVGNAGLLLEKNEGTRIDSHAKVARFNNYDLSASLEKHTGTKSDIWVTSFCTDIQPQNFKYEAVLCPFPLYDRKWAQRYQVDWELIKAQKNVLFIPLEIFNQLLKSVPQPSTGLAFLFWYYTVFGRLQQSNIYGFSFFKGRHHYFQSHSLCNHNSQHEEGLFLKLVNSEI